LIKNYTPLTDLKFKTKILHKENFYFFVEHVLMPNKAYNGQKPKAAVNIGTSPINPKNLRLL